MVIVEQTAFTWNNKLVPHAAFKIKLLIPIIILTLGFYNNQWESVSNDVFKVFQNDSNALVEGGLAHCDAYGLSRQGLWAALPENGFEDPRWVQDTHSAWLTEAKQLNWQAYKSQIGLQGLADCTLYKIIGDHLPRSTFIKLLEFLNSLILAIFIVVIINWINSLGYRGIGILFPAIIVACSPWITQIARSVYWVPWTWYLPLVLAILLSRSHAEQDKQTTTLKVFFALSIAVFIKSACGYEFISFVLVIMMLPFIEKFLKGPKGSKLNLIQNIALPAVSGLSGFFAAISLHALLRSDNFNFGNGFNAIWEDVARRTSDQFRPLESFPTIVQNSLKVPVADVLTIYSNFILVTLPGGATITAMDCIIIIIMAWLLIFLMAKDQAAQQCSIRLGLITLFSVMAPLSWFALAKGHSYIHQPINPVLWITPMIPLTMVFAVNAIPLQTYQSLRSVFANISSVIIIVVLASIHNDASLYYASHNVGRTHNTSAFSLGKDIVFIAHSSEQFDWNTKFFVHVYPSSIEDLPPDRKQFGFDNLDFEPFTEKVLMPRWSIYSKSLVFKRRVPSIYKPLKILVGQYRIDTGEQLWSEKIAVK